MFVPRRAEDEHPAAAGPWPLRRRAPIADARQRQAARLPGRVEEVRCPHPCRRRSSSRRLPTCCCATGRSRSSGRWSRPTCPLSSSSTRASPTTACGCGSSARAGMPRASTSSTCATRRTPGRWSSSARAASVRWRPPSRSSPAPRRSPSWWPTTCTAWGSAACCSSTWRRRAAGAGCGASWPRCCGRTARCSTSSWRRASRWCGTARAPASPSRWTPWPRPRRSRPPTTASARPRPAPCSRCCTRVRWRWPGRAATAPGSGRRSCARWWPAATPGTCTSCTRGPGRSRASPPYAACATCRDPSTSR